MLPSVRLSVCLSVCLSVSMFTFQYYIQNLHIICYKKAYVDGAGISPVTFDVVVGSFYVGGYEM